MTMRSSRLSLRGFLSSRDWIRNENVILAAIVIVGLALRLYGITSPLVDSYHQRQTQTAMVARNLYENGMNIFYTQYDIYGNSPGYVILEFPLLNSLVALVYFIFGVHEIIGRLIALAFSLGAILLMYRLAREFLLPRPALVATAVYALSPTNIYLSRAFMPESLMMFFSLGAVYFFLAWLKTPRLVTYAAGIACAALAFLVKTPTLLLLAPITWAWFSKYRRRGLVRIEFYVYLFFSILPIALWSIHASRVNTTTDSFLTPISFLANRGGSLAFRFSLGFWVQLLKSIALPLLTPLGLVATLAGIATAWKCSRWYVVHIWLLAVLGYFFVFAEINASHQYYQLPLLPPAALFVAFAVDKAFTWQRSRKYWDNKLARRLAWSLVVATFLAYVVMYVVFFADLYDVTKRVPYHLRVAQLVREQTPGNAILILNDPPNGLNTTLTYYAHRKSWAFDVLEGDKAVSELEALKAKGATVYVAVDSRYGSGVQDTKRNEVFWQYLNQHYKPFVLDEHYMVFDLAFQ